MSFARLHSAENGTATIEFGLTAPAFFALVFSIVSAGLLLWAQLGIQHGAEMAARCASIGTCGSTSALQTYAAQQSYGLNPPTSTFTWTTPSCGNQVAANYTVHLFTSYVAWPSLTLTAQSCFPK